MTLMPASDVSDRRALWTVVLCWTTVMLEGFDLVVLGAIIPTLIETEHLGMTDADATTIVTLSYVGVMVGALIVGPLTDRIGRRRLLIGSVLLFSVFTVFVPLANSVWLFATLRLIAGVGLGACMPVSLTLMAENLPAAMRARASTLTMTGYHMGAVLVSLLALAVGTSWQVLFYALTVAGLAVAALQFKKLPESQEFLEAQTRERSADERVGYGELLRPAYLRACLGVWVASFMGILLVYGLNSWLPRLMQEAGYPVPTAVAQLLILNVGGVLGLIVGGQVADKRGIRATALVWFGVSVVALAVLSIKFDSNLALNAVVFVTGFFVFSSQVLVYAYITHAFPARVRGTALGSASGVGRLGSIIGPTITGGLLAAGLGHPWGFYFFAGVGVLAVLAVASLPAVAGMTASRGEATPASRRPA